MRHPSRLWLTLVISGLMVVHATAQIGIRNLSGSGHFGDQALHYIKTKWLAYKYQIPFYLQPFLCADQLQLIQREKLESPSLLQSFTRHITLSHEVEVAKNIADNTFISLNVYGKGDGFNTEDIVDFLLSHAPASFINELRALFQPLTPPPPLAIPSDRISVAVHIRKPLAHDYPLISVQEFDTAPYQNTVNIIDLDQAPAKRIKPKKLYADVNENSLKFPPNQFYIDTIKQLSNYFHDAPLYVQIFTCDPHPQALCGSIARSVNKPNIIFGTPTASDSGRQNIIADCYQMSRFDCLIKSISSFSTIAQIMGEPVIVIHPNSFMWDQNKLVINGCDWLIHSQQLANLLKNRQTLATVNAPNRN